MTKAVRIQKYEALLSMLEEFAGETDNGDRTVVAEVVALVRGRLNALRKP
jgi:hypothetical protein